MPYKTPHLDSHTGSRERLLILAGGVCLTAMAGFVNVVVLGVFSVPVSHMTGAVSRLGMDLVDGNSSDLMVILMIVVGFLMGAVLSGAIIGRPRLEPGRRYGLALLAESAALGGAAYLLSSGTQAGIPVAAMACGIQNGMASSYYGLIIRTTHVTGTVTDLGFLLGQRLRGMPVEGWKIGLLTALLVGFLAGCVAGQVLLDASGPSALAYPAMAALVAGMGYFSWRSVVAHSGRAA